jgi:hypothetical protein
MRMLLAAAVVPVVALTFGVDPAAATEGTYITSRQDGVTFSLLARHNLLLGSADDQLFRVGTTLSGANKMPFPVTIYGTKYSKMTISTNGNIQLGVCCTDGTAAFTNAPLPTSVFPKPALAVFWDDLFFNPDDTNDFFKEGIFTETSGNAPHRTFIISWQGHAFSNESYFVLAQAVFTEGSTTFRFRYGSRDNQSSLAPSETIGVQGTGGSSAVATQVASNPAAPGATVAGRQYTFQHV